MTPTLASPSADALDLLATTHEHTCRLADECRRFARHGPAERELRRTADDLCRAIHRMSALEEELFYPAARAVLAGSDLVEIAVLEHATARQIVRQLHQAEPCEARYEALVVALGACVERHARHEQERLFPRLRASGIDLVALAQRIAERQRELEAAH